VVIEDKMVEEVLGKRVSYYDKSGEQHYDIISAFIKSIRGSDPDAALYWLARMIEGGEDPKFIARRMLILASEDIGNANPTALVMATNCFQAVTMIGYPECEIILSQVVIYLANSPKSNSAYLAIKTARSLVRETGDLSVPLHLRNAPTKLMKDLDYGSGYQYPHDHPGNFIKQNYLPEELTNNTIYMPGKNDRENEYLKKIRSLWSRHKGDGSGNE
jgi:putative ATPase